MQPASAVAAAQKTAPEDPMLIDFLLLLLGIELEISLILGSSFL